MLWVGGSARCARWSLHHMACRPTTRPTATSLLAHRRSAHAGSRPVAALPGYHIVSAPPQRSAAPPEAGTRAWGGRVLCPRGAARLQRLLNKHGLPRGGEVCVPAWATVAGIAGTAGVGTVATIVATTINAGSTGTTVAAVAAVIAVAAVVNIVPIVAVAVAASAIVRATTAAKAAMASAAATTVIISSEARGLGAICTGTAAAFAVP